MSVVVFYLVHVKPFVVMYTVYSSQTPPRTPEERHRIKILITKLLKGGNVPLNRGNTSCTICDY